MPLLLVSIRDLVVVLACCLGTLGAAEPIPRQAPSQSPVPQSQSAPRSASSNKTLIDAPVPKVQTDEEKRKKQQEKPEAKQTKRMLWVVPNFAAVNSNTQLPPLSTKGKFALASHDCLDYSGFTWSAILAAQNLAVNSEPELGHGMAGYGRYYWRVFADGVSGSYFTEAIVPSIRHEDPRYYTLGYGGFFRRAEYALSRVVVTKTDSGDTSFNFSETLGNGFVAGLSNAYYPPQERGAGQTLRDWATQIESAALNNIAKEFWPDIRRDLLRQK